MDAAAVGIVVLVSVSGLLAAAAARLRWDLPLWQALLIGLAVRGLCAALSQSLTPADVAYVFHDIGREIVHGRDPVLSLQAHSWNFLSLMPMVWAVLDKVGIDWVNLVKVPAIACDIGNIALVGLLSPPADAGRRRLIYALNGARGSVRVRFLRPRFRPAERCRSRSGGARPATERPRAG